MAFTVYCLKRLLEKKKHNIRPEGLEPREKKPQKPKEPEVELPVDISRLYMKVGKITNCEKHPDADALYLETIECGEEKPRQGKTQILHFWAILAGRRGLLRKSLEIRMVKSLIKLFPVSYVIFHWKKCKIEWLYYSVISNQLK